MELDLGRYGRAEELLAQAAEAPDVEAPDREQHHDRLARLADDQLAVFLLRHEQEFTFQEAADALGCSVRTAKYRMKDSKRSRGVLTQA